MARITKIELQRENTRLAAENAALRAELSKLRAAVAITTQRAETQRAETQRSVPAKPTKLEALRGFAIKFRCVARLRNNVIELYSKKRGWVAVPEGAQP